MSLRFRERVALKYLRKTFPNFEARDLTSDMVDLAIRWGKFFRRKDQEAQKLLGSA